MAGRFFASEPEKTDLRRSNPVILSIFHLPCQVFARSTPKIDVDTGVLWKTAESLSPHVRQ